MLKKRRVFQVLLLLVGTGHVMWAADASIKLTTADGSTQFSIQNSAAAQVASVDSLGNATFAKVTQTGTGGNFILNQNTLQAGATFFVSSGTVNGPLTVGGAVTAGTGANQITTAAGLLDATKLTGNLPALNGSALTSLTGTNVTGNIPGNAASITGTITPGQISAGSLPATVIASSVAVGSVQDASIVAVSASKVTGNISGNAASITGTITPSQIIAGSLGATVVASSIGVSAVQDASIVAVSASKLTGTVSDASIDSSSVTKQGNTFNAAGQLVQLNSLGDMSLPSGASITIGTVRGSIVPSGTLILTTSTCPSGFTEFTGAEGYYLVGVPSGGTVGGTVGSAMTDLLNTSHSHSITTTTANFVSTLGNTAAVTSVTTPTGSVQQSAIAPYFQIRLCGVP